MYTGDNPFIAAVGEAIKNEIEQAAEDLKKDYIRNLTGKVNAITGRYMNGLLNDLTIRETLDPKEDKKVIIVTIPHIVVEEKI